jgi:hypothetical protein
MTGVVTAPGVPVPVAVRCARHRLPHLPDQLPLSPRWRRSAGLTAAPTATAASGTARTLSWRKLTDGNVDQRFLGTLVKQAVLVPPGCAARIECVALPGLHGSVPQDDPRSIRPAVPGG